MFSFLTIIFQWRSIQKNFSNQFEHYSGRKHDETFASFSSAYRIPFLHHWRRGVLLVPRRMNRKDHVSRTGLFLHGLHVKRKGHVSRSLHSEMLGRYLWGVGEERCQEKAGLKTNNLMTHLITIRLGTKMEYFIFPVNEKG